MIRRAQLVVVASMLVLGVALVGIAPCVGVAEGLERLPAVLHLHSDLSTGDFALEQLTAMAEKQGIGALLLTENYLLRVEYGLPPFRALTRAVREERSVLDLGIDRYLTRVSQARAANPRVLIVPGVEVLPHYYWTGSPLALDMEVHETQKNILVFGLDEAALRALPVAGNLIGGFGWSSVLDALPGTLLVPGVYLLTLKRRRLKKLGRVVVVVKQRRWLVGSVLCAVAVIALVRGWPFAVDPYPPYRDLGLGPHQDLIDYVDRLGGATVWSLPEARDAGEQWVGPVKVSWFTPPYPDDLMRTARYTAFGAVYEDTTARVGGRRVGLPWIHSGEEPRKGTERVPGRGADGARPGGRAQARPAVRRGAGRRRRAGARGILRSHRRVDRGLRRCASRPRGGAGGNHRRRGVDRPCDARCPGDARAKRGRCESLDRAAAFPDGPPRHVRRLADLLSTRRARARTPSE